MAQIVIGRVRPAFVGEWQPGTLYKGLDVVSYNGASYAAKLDVPIDVDPSNTTYWQVISAKGDTGAQGAIGPQGPQGNVGPQGPPGLDGADGADGAQGVSGPAPDHEWNGYEVRFKNPDGTWGDPMNLRGATGAQGPVGPEGPEGPQGLIGPEGPTGLQGPEGLQGPDGLQGIKGDTGATGPQGTAGPQGPKGDKGDTGAAGTDGLPGVKATTTQAQIGTDDFAYMTAAKTKVAIDENSTATIDAAVEGAKNATFVEVKIGNTTRKLQAGSNNSTRVRTGNGYVDIGPQDATYCHLNTDRGSYKFNKPLYVNSDQVLTTAAGKATDSALLNGKDASYYKCSDCSWTCSSTCTGTCHNTCSGSCGSSCSSCSSCGSCKNA